MTIDDLNLVIDKRVDEKIQQLLNPTVEIYSPNGVPVLASPASSGYDIKANLLNVQTKFMQNAELRTSVDELVDSLPYLMAKGDPETFNEAMKTLDNTFYRETPIENVSIVIHPGGHCLIPTGIHTAFPDRYRAEIVPRSGNALKYRITITNSPGQIEGDYKDEWGIIIDNEGTEDFVIRQGDRICQVLFSIIVRPEFVSVDSVEGLSGEDRGGGFGHSGTN